MDKYVMANIKLPLKINRDGSYTTMNDHIEISFSNYEGTVLAEKSLDDEKTSSELNKLISEIEFPNITTVTVYKPETQSKYVSNHISFKNQNKLHKKKSYRFTIKAR